MPQQPADEAPRLRAVTLDRLALHVTGDSGAAPYRTGPMLVKLFNATGLFDDSYPQSLNSSGRKRYTDEKLRSLNGKRKLFSIIEETFDSVHFATGHKRYSLDDAVKDMNLFLQRDGLQVIADPVHGARVTRLGGAVIAATAAPAATPASTPFIDEHIRKSRDKLTSGDTSGAIASARSLCEAVLTDIESQRKPAPPKFDGDLPKLFKRVRDLLSMRNSPEASDSVNQLLTGLTSVVTGLAGMSNDLSDRHGARRVHPKMHHAELAVNAAQTICNFMLQSHARQPKDE